VQQVLRQYNIGAGATLRALEERLYADANAANSVNAANVADAVGATDAIDAAKSFDAVDAVDAVGTSGAAASLESKAPGLSAPNQPLRLLDTVVRAEWIDYNRHMTDFRYTQVFGEAMDALFRMVGVDEAYRVRGHIYFSVENHVRHLGEAKAGDALYVTTQLLGVDDKRLRVFHRLYRSRGDVLIATAEQMHLHVDTVAAKACPVGAELRAKLEAILLQQSGLPVPDAAGRSIGQVR